MVAPNPSKRIKRRVVVRDYVQVECERKGQLQKTALVNISLEGICCLFPFCPTKDELLTFNIRKSQLFFSVSAKVKWRQEIESKRFKVGFEFVKVNQEQKKHIEEFLQDSLKKLSLPFQNDSVRKTIVVCYGENLKSQGSLISINQHEIEFRGPLLDPLPATFPLRIPLLSQVLTVQVLLKTSQPIGLEQEYKAEFKDLKDNELNIIRSFLVEHYLNYD